MCFLYFNCVLFICEEMFYLFLSFLFSYVYSSPPPAEPVVQEPPHSQYSPFILVSNLRAHLYVALEKNAWLQKRIEELEEERNFLRCQLDRFIVSMRSPEGEESGNTTFPCSICVIYWLISNGSIIDEWGWIEFISVGKCTVWKQYRDNTAK